MNTGKSPGQRVIQFIGTPESSDALPRSWSSRERGCSAAKRYRSRSISSAMRLTVDLVMARTLPRAPAQSQPLCQGPVIANVSPGYWMWRNSHLPSGL